MRENLYETITVLDETPQKQCILVRHALSHVCYVKKVFAQAEDLSLYEQLMRHPHEHMACIMEAQNLDNHCVLIEEFVNGTTLEYAMSERELSVKEIQILFLELFDVLEHLHAQQPPIIHRDIKPGNIMLEKGHVKLIDFEIARKVSAEKKRDTQIIGSVGYAAPEQYGFRQSDQRSDIYALGVLMQELLELKQGYAMYQPMVERCLEMDPNKRYQSVTELRKEFLERMNLIGDEPREEAVLPSAPVWNQKLSIPGLREDETWIRVSYLGYYLLAFGLSFNLEVKPPVTDTMLILEKIAVFLIMILAVWIPNNVGNLLHFLPLYRSSNARVRFLNGLLIWFLCSFAILIGIALLGGIIEQF